MPDAPPSGLFSSISTTRALLEATGDAAWVAALLEFEEALALAERDAGVLPPEHADAVVAACRSLPVDPSLLARGARSSGTPVAPLVELLSDAAGDRSSGYVHFGATSQDALDTAAMLVAKRSCTLVLRDLDEACHACARLVSAHGATTMVARTLLQPAVPTTFSLKAACWLDSLLDARSLLAHVRDERLAVQLGGAAGTLASLGDAGPAVLAGLARRLGLREPRLAWHASRARIAELASALAVCSGAVAKIALDVVLLQQAEVRELSEGAGSSDRPGGAEGWSSTLPSKQNPVASVAVLASSRRAAALAGSLVGGLAHEHERAAGSWQAEWESLVELVRASGGAVARAAALLAGLEVDAPQMRSNLDATGGALLGERVALHLAPRIGRARAREVARRAVSAAAAPGGSLREALAGDPTARELLDGAAIEQLVEPTTYLGASHELAARVLAAYREACSAEGAPAAAHGRVET